MAWDGPKWGREDFFLANPGLANILGRMDFNFENFYFSHFLDPKFLDFQVPRFPKSGPGLGLGPGLGHGPGLGLGPALGKSRSRLTCGVLQLLKLCFFKPHPRE